MHQDDFERLYAAEAAGLLGFLVYRTGDVTLAEDVLADTFERVLRARRPFDPRRGSQKTWLYSIALNRLTDLRRRQTAEDRALERVSAGDPGTAAQPPAEAIGERDAITTALRALSAEEREAVALRYGADLSLDEIARIAGTPVTTIKGRLHRGLQTLREELG